MSHSPSAPENVFQSAGDIEVASGLGQTTRLTVGGNGTVLTADSTQAAGVSWKTPGASSAFSWTRQTANYTAHHLDIVGCVTTSGSFTVTLPAVAMNLTVIVKKLSADLNTVTVVGAVNTALIEGVVNDVLSTLYVSRQYFCDGTAWWKI